MELTNEKLNEIKERCAKATPGPWEWDVHTKNREVKLLTTHSGRYCVMGFERWGPQGAAPKFQVYEKYEGTMRERKSMAMFRADLLTKSYPGLEHHVGWDDYIDHPDALFISHAKEDIELLLAEIERLKKKDFSCDDAPKQDGKCVGYAKSDIDDEPMNKCMECKENIFYEGE